MRSWFMKMPGSRVKEASRQLAAVVVLALMGAFGPAGSGYLYAGPATGEPGPDGSAFFNPAAAATQPHSVPEAGGPMAAGEPDLPILRDSVQQAAYRGDTAAMRRLLEQLEGRIELAVDQAARQPGAETGAAAHGACEEAGMDRDVAGAADGEIGTAITEAVLLRYYKGFLHFNMAVQYRHGSEDGQAGQDPQDSEHHVDRAIELLERTVELAPGFADGHALLAASYAEKARGGVLSAMRYGLRHQRALGRAVDAGPDNIRVRLMQALSRYHRPSAIGGSEEQGLEKMLQMAREWEEQGMPGAGTSEGRPPEAGPCEGSSPEAGSFGGRSPGAGSPQAGQTEAGSPGAGGLEANELAADDPQAPAPAASNGGAPAQSLAPDACPSWGVADLYAWIAYAYEQKGRMDEAGRWAGKALQVEPAFERARQIHERVRGESR